jgi:1-acyl-sn-glycerol-3-phosphate acyltransferase
MNSETPPPIPRKAGSPTLERCKAFASILFPATAHTKSAGPFPDSGAILVSNHQSYVDWATIQVSCPRPVRFVAFALFFRFWWSGWFLRAFGSIPIEPAKAIGSLKSVIEAAKRGEWVCIFAEGEISRTGRLLQIRQGYQVAAIRAGVPVIPVWIESLWGSRWSFFGGRLLLGKRPVLPRPTRIHFGSPVPPELATPARIRKELEILSAHAFAKRADVLQGHAGIRASIRALRNPWRTVLVEATAAGSKSWSAGALIALASEWAGVWQTRDSKLAVACLLPPGLARSVVELAFARMDRPLLCLEPGIPVDLARASIRQTGARLLLAGGPSPTLQASLGDDVEVIPALQPLHEAGSLQRLTSLLLANLPGINSLLLDSVAPGADSPWKVPARRCLQLELSGDATGRWFIMPGAGPGWLPVWLPLLTCAQVVCAAPGPGKGWITELCRRHRLTTVVARGNQIMEWLDAGEDLKGSGLMRIIVLDTDVPAGDLARAAGAWSVPVHRGWCDPLTGCLLSLEAADVPGGKSSQPGSRAGSRGKPLPGVALRSRIDPDGAASIELLAPFEGIRDWVDTGLPGSIDTDGFVIPDGEAPAASGSG